MIANDLQVEPAAAVRPAEMFNNFVQIGIVVRDLDRTVKALERDIWHRALALHHLSAARARRCRAGIPRGARSLRPPDRFCQPGTDRDGDLRAGGGGRAKLAHRVSG